jgi:hypothetical protein
MAKGYRVELDTVRIQNVNSGIHRDILITLTQLENGKLIWEAWKVESNSQDGEGITESKEFSKQKTTFFKVPGLSFNGFPRPIFVCGMGKRNALTQRIMVMNEVEQ